MKPVGEIILPESELEIMTAVWNAEEALHRPVYSREINNYGSDYVKEIAQSDSRASRSPCSAQPPPQSSS